MAGHSMQFDPIAEAKANWTSAGWGDVAEGMVAVTCTCRRSLALVMGSAPLREKASSRSNS